MEYLLTEIVNFAGAWTPALLILLFALSACLIIWRLESMSNRGPKGSALASLFMPYLSGLGNLTFVWIVLHREAPAGAVAINAWTNNLTSLCLLLAVPALIWGLNLNPISRAQKAQREAKAQCLSVSVQLIFAVLFTLCIWMLGRDGEIQRVNGIALLGLFLSWQCYRVFEVLKANKWHNDDWHPLLVLDALLILTSGFMIMLATNGIVNSIMLQEDGFFSSERLGLLTGWLLVLPNAMLAFYYAWQQRSSTAYTSLISDNYICMPLGIGLFALFKPLPLTEFYQNGLIFLSAVALVHLLCVGLLRELPKLVAVGMVAVYGYALFIQVSL